MLVGSREQKRHRVSVPSRRRGNMRGNKGRNVPKMIRENIGECQYEEKGGDEGFGFFVSLLQCCIPRTLKHITDL